MGEESTKNSQPQLITDYYIQHSTFSIQQINP